MQPISRVVITYADEAEQTFTGKGQVQLVETTRTVGDKPEPIRFIFLSLQLPDAEEVEP